MFLFRSISQNPQYTEKLWSILRNEGTDKIEKLKAFLSAETYLDLTPFNIVDVTGKASVEDINNLAKVLIEAPVERLNFNYNDLDVEKMKVLIEALKQNTSLTELDFKSSFAWVDSFIVLADALKEKENFQRLTSLNLKSNLLGDRGGVAISEFLAQSKKLAELNLNHIGIGDKGVIALANSLKKNSSLTYLNLKSNPITELGIQALADMLNENTKLSTLVLSSNYIYEELNTVKPLVLALKSNKTLRKLELRDYRHMDLDPLEKELIESLADLLKESTTLATLNLQNNQISDRSLEILSEALKENSALTSLSLKKNPITGKGLVYLCDALKKNSSLTYLNLKSTKIDEEGVKALLDALDQNKTLLSVEFDQKIYMTETTIDAIIARLNENRALAKQRRLDQENLHIIFPKNFPKELANMIGEYAVVDEPPPIVINKLPKQQPVQPVFVTGSVPPRASLFSAIFSTIKKWAHSVWDAIVSFFKNIKNKNTVTHSQNNSVSVPNQTVTPRVDQLNKNSVQDSPAHKEQIHANTLKKNKKSI